jgi:hypothetical protein
MSLWVCAACTTAYSVGAPRCPHCAGTDYFEEGQDVGKISKHAGATIVGEVAPEPVTEPIAPEVPEPEPAEPKPTSEVIAELVPAPVPVKKPAAKKTTA